MKIPCITGEWRVLFKPEVHGNCVNDHSIVKGSDGLWHIYGITSFEGTPGAERYFAHGKGESLEGELREVGSSIDRGTLAWAPSVIEKDGLYYLFVTYTDCSDTTYSDTLVFASETPEFFGECNGGIGGALPVTKLKAHAPEIIEDNGKYYITTCGWKNKPIPNGGCVSVAELEWI